jgi:hypothetical protein
MERLTFEDIEMRVQVEDTTLLPGWVIVPSDSRVKHPRFEHWQEFPYPDPEARRRMAGRISHDAWSLLTGQSGVYVVDLDVKAGIDGVSAWKTLMQNEPQSSRPRIIGTTPSGGKHLYFSPPPAGYRQNNTAGSVPGIDSRGLGGQVLIAGPGRTLHIQEWEFPPVPQPWLDVIAVPTPQTIGDALVRRAQTLTRENPTRRERGREVARMALMGAGEAVVNAGEGRRNTLLNWAAYVAGREAIAAGWDTDTVEAVLLGAALEAGLEQGEAEATIKSGLGL